MVSDVIYLSPEQRKNYSEKLDLGIRQIDYVLALLGRNQQLFEILEKNETCKQEMGKECFNQAKTKLEELKKPYEELSIMAAKMLGKLKGSSVINSSDLKSFEEAYKNGVGNQDWRLGRQLVFDGHDLIYKNLTSEMLSGASSLSQSLREAGFIFWIENTPNSFNIMDDSFSQVWPIEKDVSKDRWSCDSTEFSGINWYMHPAMNTQHNFDMLVKGLCETSVKPPRSYP